MKKSFLIITVMFMGLLLIGCQPKGKTFTKVGVSVTLNKTFVEKEVMQAPFYLESTNHLFMANRESKTDVGAFGIKTLDEYAKAVLNTAKKTATVETIKEGDVTYKYAYYTSTVGEQTFGYMLVTMEGKDHFYTINFGCLESKLNENKDQFHKWAKTITVE